MKAATENIEMNGYTYSGTIKSILSWCWYREGSSIKSAFQYREQIWLGILGSYFKCIGSNVISCL